jgi:hypothetical protein
MDATRALALSAMFGLMGCLSGQYTPPPGPGDPMPQSPVQSPSDNQDGSVDFASAPSPTPSSDMAGTPAAGDMAGTPPAGDMAGAPPGAKPFGATCTVDGDCASGMCRGFVMQTILRCTQPCTVATQATDCPSPPSAGQCTNMGYCKFTQ